MFVETVAAKGITGVGWISLLAVDSNVVPIDLDESLHNLILGAVIVASIAILSTLKKRGGSGRTYADGVVDGMRLTAADPDVPAPRQGPGAKVLYLRTASNVDRCTQRAPKPLKMRSS